MYPLRMGVASSDRVLIANSALFNTAAAFSLGGWIYPRSLTRNKRMYSKAGLGTGWEILQRQGSLPGATAPNFEVPRATTTAVAQGAVDTLVAGIPVWYGFTYSDADGARIFTRRLNTAVTELAYTTRTVGSGAYVSNSVDITVGNDPAFATASDTLMWTFFLETSRLDLRDLIPYASRRWLPRGVIAMRLGKNGPTGRVIDESGYNNHGTITGATPTNDRLPGFGRRAA